MSEVLNEGDLDWLTGAENRLIRMRKRETEHKGAAGVANYISDSIGSIHVVRQYLQARFEKEMDPDL